MTDSKENCPFCDLSTLQNRLIRAESHCFSIVSQKSFRTGHCLVVPRAHITSLGLLSPIAAFQIMQEMGRLEDALDRGYGTGIMRKYDPLQEENGVKVKHLHFHVFPRFEIEPGLFPVPTPNSFKGFHERDIGELEALAKSLG